jgi:diacylglycerol O-acyltransferase / wax synthase
MKRLNGMDAMLLYGEAPNLHMHTLKVAVLHAERSGTSYTFESFRKSFEERLRYLDPLRWRLIETPWRLHHPLWVEDCEVDLDYHLRRVKVPSPGGRRELNQVIGEVASTPLSRTRPLWEFHFAEGLTDNRFALIGKVHHSLADGVASANLMARLMGLQLGPEGLPRLQESPKSRALLRTAGRDHVEQLAKLPKLIQDAATGLYGVRRRAKDRGERPDMAKMFKPPPSFLNHVVSPSRTFASATLSLADAKETAKRLNVTFNDLVLATVAGALRDLLLRYDGRADRPLLSNVPVSTDKSADRISGNALSGLPVSLPVHVDDPIERVRLTALATRIAKDDHQIVGPDLYSRMMNYVPTALAPAIFRRQAARAARNSVMNVPVSNVPGPRERGEIGGAPVTEFYSTGVLSAGAAVNITVWSYVDQLDIAVLSDDRTFDDVHEATDAIVHAFAEIRSAAGLTGSLSAVSTAMASATDHRSDGDRS